MRPGEIFRLTVLMFFYASVALQEGTAFAREDKLKIAIFPFLAREVPADSVMQWRLNLAQALMSNDQFEIMNIEVMHAFLKASGFVEIEQCTLPPCVANFGKILGVERVIYGSIEKSNEGFTLQVRVVHVEKGGMIFEKIFQYTGSFEKLLTETPLQVVLGLQKAEESLRGKKRLYLVGGAVVALGTTIFLISKALDIGKKQTPIADDEKPPPPPGQE